MTGNAHALAANSAGGVKGVTGWNVNANAAIGSNSGGAIIFGQDGSITKVINFGTSKGTDGSPYWWAPPSPGGAQANYFIRATVTAGTMDANSAIWVSLVSHIGLGFYQAGGTTNQSATLTVDIATDSGGTNIVFSAAGIIVQRTHT